MSTWYQNLRTTTCSLRLRAFTPGSTPGVLSPISDSLRRYTPFKKTLPYIYEVCGAADRTHILRL